MIFIGILCGRWAHILNIVGIILLSVLRTEVPNQGATNLN